jgi:hypothetical protein
VHRKQEDKQGRLLVGWWVLAEKLVDSMGWEERAAGDRVVEFEEVEWRPAALLALYLPCCLMFLRQVLSFLNEKNASKL